MTAFWAILSVILIAVIAVQIGKVSELAAKIRGEAEVEDRVNRSTGLYLLLFMVGFLIFCGASAYYYKNYMLGFGPHTAASTHGVLIDNLFWTTTLVCGFVFVLTQVALFWYSYKYRAEKGRKVLYIPHDNKLEIIWTAIPAVVMTFLVVGGLDVWNEVMADVGINEDIMEIEATGYQFAWTLRYPGADGKLGPRNFRIIDGTNPLGQDWTDESNLDDLHPNELVLPKGKKVRVRIMARDVLHDFYLPQFRVKMDAVPGIPTYFVFTPEMTTEEYRKELRQYPEYNVPDPNDPEKMLWETFEYELACAELCGTGHWSMRKVVRILEQKDYDAWLKEQQSYYLTSIYGTDADPWPIDNRLPAVSANFRKAEFDDAFETAFNATTPEDRSFVLKYVHFETGTASLTDMSTRYELTNVVEAMKEYPDLRIELGGHTDNQGGDEVNIPISQNRADAVYNYLISKGIAADRLTSVGYGESQPIDTNETATGRANNRRTQFTILSGEPNEMIEAAVEAEADVE